MNKSKITELEAVLMTLRISTNRITCAGQKLRELGAGCFMMESAHAATEANRSLVSDVASTLCQLRGEHRSTEFGQCYECGLDLLLKYEQETVLDGAKGDAL